MSNNIGWIGWKAAALLWIHKIEPADCLYFASGPTHPDGIVIIVKTRRDGWRAWTVAPHNIPISRF